MTTIPTVEQARDLLRAETAQQRVEILTRLPPSPFTAEVRALIQADNPTHVILALVGPIYTYCEGAAPEVGVVLAAAAHERAMELWTATADHGGLILPTLSGFADSHCKALELLGRSEEVLREADRYIELYTRLGDVDNLPALKVRRARALLNLGRIDDAEAALNDATIARHPTASTDGDRLKRQIDGIKIGVIMPKATGGKGPEPITSAEIAKRIGGIIAPVLGRQDGGMLPADIEADLKRQIDAVKSNLTTSRTVSGGEASQSIDPEQLVRITDQMLPRIAPSGAESDITIRHKIQQASIIFVRKPTKDEILHSLASLMSCLAWTTEHGLVGLENEALWGIYLCYSRLGQSSEAADALVNLRTNLEGMRRGIKDPLKRGGIFASHPHLFGAMCEHLQRAGRQADLLEAIEASKGRAIADRLTEQEAGVVDDAAIYECVRSLPDLTCRERFHYLTYFVDEERVHAVLVTKQGKIHMPDPIPIASGYLRNDAKYVDPRRWGKPQRDPVAAHIVLIESIQVSLAPLVTWLDALVEQAVLEKDDHICYSTDDALHNVPLHYLHFKGGMLIDWFSLSRVHSAFHLDLLLRKPAAPAPNRYLGIAVPLLHEQGKEAFVESLEAPLRWLQAHCREGHSLRGVDATLQRITQETWDGCIVHFSTHGMFPREGGGPFHESYLLLADEHGLPVDSRGGKLSPSEILTAGLDLSGSHVSIMACISGLARKGVAGDALGLDWAFIQAGAASLISTHWDVNVAAAARFFTSFYEKWATQGRSRAQAHREAMLECLGGDRSTAVLNSWSAFSLTGDFR